jgi:valyl-tRNA synthetase
MEKAYEPSKYEPQIRELWQKHNSFALGSNQTQRPVSLDTEKEEPCQEQARRPDEVQGVDEQRSEAHSEIHRTSSATNNAATRQTDSSADKPFTIIMPPPNANGSLHAGHLMYVVEDIMTRTARMQGRPTLWQPGTDHAGIETQFVYEKELAKIGKSRHDLGQAKFYSEVWDFVENHKGTMISQMRAMGFSADWSKLKYTLDEDIVDIVLDTFKELHDGGYIYRGNRIVNWDPVTQSAYADIELKHVEREDEIYTLDYGAVQIATTRPETIFADVAVAINPKDQRFSDISNATATIPLIDRPIPIIADEHVDPDFGTGALKVTPGHDKNDYEIGLRHNLPQLTVVDFEGKMINVPEKYAGLSVEEARHAVVGDLEVAGKLVKRDKITHSVAIQDRSGAVIEPLITEQWFMRMADLNRPVIEAIENEQVKIHPKRFKKIALEWLKNEHDWCISRQIWWGIRIPVYYKTSHDAEKTAYIIAKSEDEAIAYYGKGNYRAETDTFDTWFSSGQWPYATLMTSLGNAWQSHYPTTVMATARDILHKWVTRMIMFSIYKTDRVPFENVYLWGMVTDEKGQKLSKSKGNYGDPMEITAKYGTDALRLALSIGITPGNDGKLSDEKIKGYRNFCNKLWNVARFTTGRLEENYSPKPPELLSPADHWIIEKTNTAIESVTRHLDNYRFSEAGEMVYHLLWSELADCYIEYSKQSLNSEVLAYVLDVVLKLAHPFAPFVTEAIWQELPWTDTNLITEHWPISIIRTNTEHAKSFDIEIATIIAKKQSDSDRALLTKLQKQISEKENHIALIEAKLASKSFIENAPRPVVEAERNRLTEAHNEYQKLRNAINQLQKA